ncbi:hypothetical protein RJ639_044585, partial [Escallonia herrerae]
MALSAIATLSRHPFCSTTTSSSSSFTHITRLFITGHTPTQRHQYCKRMASSSQPPSPTSEAAKEKLTAPYGSWTSPITANVISGAEKSLGGSAVDPHGRLFWLESRPAESGRSVLVKGPDKAGDEPTDITPKEFAVRTVTQEYGGGAFTISGDTVIFSNYKDQRLYKQPIERKDSTPVPLTPDYGGPLVSYADGVFDTRFSRYVTVREDRRESSLNPATTIVSIDLDNESIQEPKVLVCGSDFYAFPHLDAKGKRIAWIEWNHPNMPWDRSELWVGDIHKRICVAGGDLRLVESPTEPKWSSQGELFFITDRTSGFWNLHKWIESRNDVLPVYSLDAEFARPLWVFGMNSYEVTLSNEQKNLIFRKTYGQNGSSYLGVLDDAKSTLSILDVPFTDIINFTSGLQCLYVEGASAVHPLSIAKVTFNDEKSKAVDFQIMWSSSPSSSNYKSYFSKPELIEFPTEVPGQSAYAYYYPPMSPIYQASQEEKPPLLLKSH